MTSKKTSLFAQCLAFRMMLADVQNNKHWLDNCSFLSLFLSEYPSFTNKVCGERFFFSISWTSDCCYNYTTVTYDF